MFIEPSMNLVRQPYYDYKLYPEEIIMNPEIEINFHACNIFYPKNRIVYLFYFCHNMAICRDGIDSEETIVDHEWNDYRMDEKITKILYWRIMIKKIVECNVIIIINRLVLGNPP